MRLEVGLGQCGLGQIWIGLNLVFDLGSNVFNRRATVRDHRLLTPRESST